MLSDKNKANNIDEITENIVILFDKNLFTNFDEIKNKPIFEDGTSLWNKFNVIADSKQNEYLGLSTKTKFKYMYDLSWKINAKIEIYVIYVIT